MAALQSCGIILPCVHLGRVGTLLERGDALQQEIVQHHHRHQTVLYQKLDPLSHREVGRLQIGNLLPAAAMTRRRSGRQHQPIMDFCLHNHPITPPVVPLTRGEGSDVHIWTLGPVLEVVTTDGGHPLSRRAQHVEEPKQEHRWPHAHVHLIEVDEDRHQRDGV
jgi:hypothetical protein